MTALNYLNNSKTESSIKANGYVEISPEAVKELRQSVNPLTLPYIDVEGRTIQLWNSQIGLVASVTSEQGIVIVSGNNIINPLQTSENSHQLVKRLEVCGLRKWQFSYSETTKKIVIWPHMVAAGKDDPTCWNPPAIKETSDCLGHIFKNDRGHFAKDTPENRAFIHQAVSHPSNKVATDRFGKEVYVKTLPDGSQAWAHVWRGKIIDGGRNEPPRKWVQGHPKHGGQLKDFYAATSFTVRPSRSPAEKQFQQTLQQTHLTESYNGSHPNRPVAARGKASGQIGGVGHKLGMIQGLFDHPEALFEKEHYFMVPMEGEKVPFSERELKLILRELAIGIYAHEAVPFFSLEFNQDGHLFPVIHPVYEGTLVGRVIGMLDYMMKGFLNGGVFYEKFVDEWRAHPNWDRMSALNQMVMFDEYVKNERLELGSGYQSFRLMIEDYLVKKKKKLTEENRTLTHDSEFFEDYTKFSNSFRIIAKQGSFKKGESLFMLDGDFDVFYTLQPDPEYQKRLDAFRLKHGRDPLGYVALDKCAKKMCQRIHDQMRHFPLFEEYFSMLNVINFFSSYFMTLKAHDTIPYFPRMTLLSLFLKSDQSCHLFPIIDVAA